jgi:hypothetical protein
VNLTPVIPGGGQQKTATTFDKPHTTRAAGGTLKGPAIPPPSPRHRSHHQSTTRLYRHTKTILSATRRSTSTARRHARLNDLPWGRRATPFDGHADWVKSNALTAHVRSVLSCALRHTLRQLLSHPTGASAPVPLWAACVQAAVSLRANAQRRVPFAASTRADAPTPRAPLANRPAPQKPGDLQGTSYRISKFPAVIWKYRYRFES